MRCSRSRRVCSRPCENLAKISERQHFWINLFIRCRREITWQAECLQQSREHRGLGLVKAQCGIAVSGNIESPRAESCKGTGVFEVAEDHPQGMSTRKS